MLFRGAQANLYVYVGNDPINRMDPTGLRCESFGERWWDAFRETNEFIPGHTRSTRPGHDHGTRDGRALRSTYPAPVRVEWLQPTGYPAYLTAGETFGVAAGATVVNALAVAAAYETGVAIGSLIIAAATGGDDCPCE